MYIEYKDNKYPCKADVVTDVSAKYWLLPEDFPAPVEGEVILCADDGFELRRDNSADYLRQTFANGVLTLTNEPEPVPVEPSEPPAPEPTVWDEMAAAITEGVNDV